MSVLSLNRTPCDRMWGTTQSTKEWPLGIYCRNTHKGRDITSPPLHMCSKWTTSRSRTKEPVKRSRNSRRTWRRATHANPGTLSRFLHEFGILATTRANPTDRPSPCTQEEKRDEWRAWHKHWLCKMANKSDKKRARVVTKHEQVFWCERILWSEKQME